MKDLNKSLTKEIKETADSINIAPTWEDLLVLMLQMYDSTSYEGKIEFEMNVRIAGQIMDRLSSLINTMQPVIELVQGSDLNELDAKKIKKLDKKINEIIALVNRYKE